MIFFPGVEDLNLDRNLKFKEGAEIPTAPRWNAKWLISLPNYQFNYAHNFNDQMPNFTQTCVAFRNVFRTLSNVCDVAFFCESR